MTFTPILSDQSLSYAYNRSYYRNANREAQWGHPVYFTPHDRALGVNGFGGPHYREGYNYNNSPETAKGNCTWWCCGRLREAEGKNIISYMGGQSPDAKNWYDAYTGSKDRNANNIVAGDIIVFTDSDAGHVMFVERVQNGVIYISHSAWSYRSYWDDYACRVNQYNVSEIYQGNSIDMYRGTGSPHYETVVGVIHTGSGSGPTPEPEEPEITILPASYNVAMSASEDYVDFPFSITIAGIPDGESASGGNTYPGLYRVYNTGWSYTSYTGGDGNTYLRATKQQTLRYDRESDGAYTTTKHMYYNMTFSNGSIYSDTPMSINVEAKPHPGPTGEGILMLEWYGGGVQIL